MFRFQIKLAGRYLWGRKLRTFLTTLAIVFGTLVIFGMGILLPSMMQSFQSNLMAVSGQVDVTVTLKTGEAFSRKLLNRVRAVEGIRAIAGSLSRTVNIPSDYYGRADVTALTLTGIDAREAQTLRSYPVKDGRFLHADDDYAAVITTSLAESLGLTVGDELNLPTAEGSAALKVVGLLPARALPGNEEVLITLYQAQKLLDLPERINTIEADLASTDEAEREAIQQQIQALVGEDYTLGGLSSGTDILASIKTGQMMFNLFGFLSIIMGGFIIFNTFRTIVAERRHDIGMLRSLGAGRRTIIGLIMTEGLLQGIVGTAVGITLGYLMGVGILAMMGPMMSQFLHIDMGGPVVEPGLVVMTVVLGVGVTLLAGLLPAFSASRVTPLEALRPSTAEVVQRTAKAGAITGFVLVALAVFALASGNVGLTALGGLMFLVGLVLVAPILVKPIAAMLSRAVALIYTQDGTGTLAQGNLTRQPTRAAVTASATMIGLAIIVGMGGMVFSLTGTFVNILQKSLGSDYMLMPPSVGMWASNVGANQGLADRLRSIPGVEAVSTMRFASATADGKAVSLLGIDPQVYPQVASLTFQEGDGATAFAALASEPSLIANGVFAAQGGFKVGDVAQLSTPTGVKPYRIAAIAGDYLNAKIMTAYISQANLSRDFRKSEDIFIQLNLAPTADQARVEEKMKEVIEDYPQFKLVSGKSYFEENKALFDSIFLFYFVLLGVLALPSLIALLNTLAIGVIERTREIGMLRAIGATRKQVRRTVIVEALLLAAIGTALGLLAGLYLGYVMVMGFSVAGFPVEYVFPGAGLLAATAVGLLFGVLAALLPARQAAKMDIIRALRYE